MKNEYKIELINLDIFDIHKHEDVSLIEYIQWQKERLDITFEEFEKNIPASVKEQLKQSPTKDLEKEKLNYYFKLNKSKRIFQFVDILKNKNDKFEVTYFIDNFCVPFNKSTEYSLFIETDNINYIKLYIKTNTSLDEIANFSFLDFTTSLSTAIALNFKIQPAHKIVNYFFKEFILQLNDDDEIEEKFIQFLLKDKETLNIKDITFFMQDLNIQSLKEKYFIINKEWLEEHTTKNKGFKNINNETVKSINNLQANIVNIDNKKSGWINGLINKKINMFQKTLFEQLCGLDRNQQKQTLFYFKMNLGDELFNKEILLEKCSIDKDMLPQEQNKYANNKNFIINKEWILEHTLKGGKAINSAQASLVSLKWSDITSGGWMNKIIGKELTPYKKELFEKLHGIAGKKNQAKFILYFSKK